MGLHTSGDSRKRVSSAAEYFLPILPTYSERSNVVAFQADGIKRCTSRVWAIRNYSVHCMGPCSGRNSRLVGSVVVVWMRTRRQLT